jgi:hypothetical protein
LPRRDIETLAEHPQYGEIKQHVLHRAPGGETPSRLTLVPGVGNESTVITEVEAMSTSELRDRLEESIHQHRDEYVAIAKDIHAHPETGNNEYANGVLTQLLEKHGFTVTSNVAGHETAFYAVKESGKPGQPLPIWRNTMR